MKIKKNVTGLWGLVKDTVHSLMSKFSNLRSVDRCRSVPQLIFSQKKFQKF